MIQKIDSNKFSLTILKVTTFSRIRHFAHKIGLEEFELDKLLNGTLCLSPEIASSLERFWGIPASYWLSLQSAYEEDLDNYSSFGKQSQLGFHYWNILRCITV